MKKVLSIICSLTIFLTSINIVIQTFASTSNSIDMVVENLSQLYQEEAESGKDIEESANCRIIVKSNRKLDTYGDAQFVKGTNKIYIYQYSDTSSANEALEYFNSLNFVEWAEPDGIMESQSLSYGNDMLGSDEAKEYIVNNNILTNKVNVAVIDVGINFRKKDFINSGRVFDSGVNLSTSGKEGSAQADSGNYHGSNITSIILDNTTDNVNITGYKVLDSKGLTTDSAMSAGIIKAVDDGADILNCSTSGEGKSSIMEEAVNYAISKGVVVVAASGNNCDDASKYCPGNIEGVFTVGALDYNGNRAIFSNYGDVVDFIAPGYNVEVYGNKSMTSNNPDYEIGTSFATPYVTSAAAMVLSVNKNLTIGEVKKKLIDSCITQSKLNYRSNYLSDVKISDSYLSGYVACGNADDESLFYGYGMPQMQVLVGIENICSSPVFSVSSGIFNDEFELTITADENSEIYYTTDGSYPSNDSIKYIEPITISSTSSIRAIAYCNNMTKSFVTAQEYKIEYLADECDFSIDEHGFITGYIGKGKNNNYIEIKVPETINGITVKGVAKRAFYDKSEQEEIELFEEQDKHLKGIVLPDTVTEIEEEAFLNNFSLKYFTANGLKIIGEHALESPIVYLDAPNVEYIGYGGLTYTELSKIDFQNLIYASDVAFAENKYLYEVNLPNIQSGGSGLFKNCLRLHSVSMPLCNVLGDESFDFCRSLKEVSLSKLSTISKGANSTYDSHGMFGTCTSLNSIDLPSLETVDASSKRLFAFCTNLVTFNAIKLQNICEKMFYSCYSLENVNIPKAISIDKRAFYNTISLHNISIPKVKEILDDAFCNSIISYIEAPELIYIGSYVFSAYDEMGQCYLINGMSSKEVTIIAPKLEEVANYAFSYTKNICKLDLLSLKTIGKNAFYESYVNYLYSPNLETTESLPIADNSVIVTSSSLTNCTVTEPNQTLYIQGDMDSYAENYSSVHNLEFIDINAMGRSIRTTNPSLRFGYSFYDTQDKNVEEYGFIYHYNYHNDPLTSSELTIDNVGTENIKKKAAVNLDNTEEGKTKFNLVFTNIPDSNQSTNISVRAYVCIDGIYFYSNTLNGSFSEVAELVLADDEIDIVTINAIKKMLVQEV